MPDLVLSEIQLNLSPYQASILQAIASAQTSLTFTPPQLAALRQFAQAIAAAHVPAEQSAVINFILNAAEAGNPLSLSLTQKNTLQALINSATRLTPEQVAVLDRVANENSWSRHPFALAWHWTWFFWEALTVVQVLRLMHHHPAIAAALGRALAHLTGHVIAAKLETIGWIFRWAIRIVGGGADIVLPDIQVVPPKGVQILRGTGARIVRFLRSLRSISRQIEIVGEAAPGSVVNTSAEVVELARAGAIRVPPQVRLTPNLELGGISAPAEEAAIAAEVASGELPVSRATFAQAQAEQGAIAAARLLEETGAPPPALTLEEEYWQLSRSPEPLGVPRYRRPHPLPRSPLPSSLPASSASRELRGGLFNLRKPLFPELPPSPAPLYPSPYGPQPPLPRPPLYVRPYLPEFPMPRPSPLLAGSTFSPIVIAPPATGPVTSLELRTRVVLPLSAPPVMVTVPLTPPPPPPPPPVMVTVPLTHPPLPAQPGMTRLEMGQSVLPGEDFSLTLDESGNVVEGVAGSEAGARSVLVRAGTYAWRFGRPALRGILWLSNLAFWPLIGFEIARHVLSLLEHHFTEQERLARLPIGVNDPLVERSNGENSREEWLFHRNVYLADLHRVPIEAIEEYVEVFLDQPRTYATINVWNRDPSEVYSSLIPLNPPWWSHPWTNFWKLRHDLFIAKYYRQLKEIEQFIRREEARARAAAVAPPPVAPPPVRPPLPMVAAVPPWALVRLGVFQDNTWVLIYENEALASFSNRLAGETAGNRLIGELVAAPGQAAAIVARYRDVNIPLRLVNGILRPK